jgi:hypothetical protein
MDVFGIAPWGLRPAPEVLADIKVSDEEFESLLAQSYGFPAPSQLPPPAGVFDPDSMPGIWPEDLLRIACDPQSGVDDAQMSPGDYAQDAIGVELPPRHFTD